MATPNRRRLRHKTGDNDNRDENSSDATAIAWNEQTNSQLQKARRVKAWLKNSVTNLTSPSAFEFENSTPKRFRRRDPARSPFQGSTTTRRSASTMTSSKTTTTIDQAMFSLYTYTGPKKKLLGTSAVQIEPETPSSYVPNFEDDWILDGRGDWKQDRETSEEYLKYLNEAWDMESYIDKYLSEREKMVRQEIKDEEEAFQFDAKFEEIAFPEETSTDPIVNVEHFGTEFGGLSYPEAIEEEPKCNDAAKDESEEEEFGDFQVAEAGDTNDDLEADKKMDSRLQTPPSPKEKGTNSGDNNCEESVKQLIPGDSASQGNESAQKSAGFTEENKCTHDEPKNQSFHSARGTPIPAEISVPSDASCDAPNAAQNTDDPEGTHGETDNSTVKDVPARILCDNLIHSPVMSMGDSIFTGSYINEELESSEEEIYAEAVHILQTVRSTGTAGVRAVQAKRVERAGETKIEISSDNSDMEQDGADGKQTSSEVASSEDTLKEVATSKEKAAQNISDAAFDQAKTKNECEVRPKDQELVNFSNVDGTTHDDSATAIQKAQISVLDQSTEPNENGQPSMHDSDDDFGDFVEAPPLTNIIVSDLSREGPEETGYLDENIYEYDDDACDDTEGHFDDVQGASDYVLPVSSLERGGPGVTATSDERPSETRFGPTFAVLSPLNIDTPLKSHRQVVESVSEGTMIESIQRSKSHFDAAADREPLDYDIFSLGSQTSHDIPVSLRLPITDLSTAEARFTRRQWLKNKNINIEKDARQKDPNPPPVADIETKLDGVDEDDGDSLSISDLDIPQHYFIQVHDDTARVLQNAPWHHIPHLWQDPEDADSNPFKIASAYSFDDQEDRRALWEEYLTNELCHLDGAQNKVAKLVLQNIRPHAPTLKVANQAIHEFATNLQLADMYLKRSQASVRQAALGTFDDNRERFEPDVGWYGAHELLKAWEQQEMYRRFQTTLTQLQDLIDTDHTLTRHVENFKYDKDNPRSYATLIKQIENLTTGVLSNDASIRLKALDGLRDRLRQCTLLLSFQDRLHILAESVAVRCCRRRQFVTYEEYSTLLQAVLQVQHATLKVERACVNAEQNKQACLDEEGQPCYPSVPYAKLNETWPQKCLEALCYEAKRSLAASLLDPMIYGNTSSTADSEYEKELTQLAYEIQQDWGDSAKLRTVTHNLVIIRFNWENAQHRYLLPVYHRLCVILADVLYAHNMFQQWHERLVDEQEKWARNKNNENYSKEEKKDEISGDESSEGLNAGNGNYRDDYVATLKDIRMEWLNNRDILYKNCEQVLIQCLDEYLHFASHDSLFPKRVHEESSSSHGSSEIDGSLWRLDLEELYNLMVLTDEFMTVRKSFLGDGACEQCDTSSMGSKINGDLRDKLCDVFRKHLRQVHVEAMKSLGMGLSQENWSLVPLKDILNKGEAISLPEMVLGVLTKTCDYFDKNCFRLRGSGMDNASQFKKDTEVCNVRSIFGQQQKNVPSNPFLAMNSSGKPGTDDDHIPIVGNEDNDRNPIKFDSGRRIYEMIDNALADGDAATSFSRIASASINMVFIPWIARLLLIMQRLPLIVEDIAAVFANLCDLYFTTVFRLCAGNAVNERLLLGIDSPAQPILCSDAIPSASPRKPKVTASSPPLFSAFRRRSSSASLESGRRRYSIPKLEILNTLEGNICSPLRSEIYDINSTQTFVKRAQKSLKDIVILDKVDDWFKDPVIVGAAPEDCDNITTQAIGNQEMRLGAAWSCLAVAATLDAACKIAREKLTKSSPGRQFVEDLSTFEHYTQAVFSMLPKLVFVSSRISCVRAILAKRVVAEILEVGGGWEECELNEHPNEYIDALCGRFADIWAGLSLSKKKLPRGLLETAWEDMVSGGYMTLLEGFSRVPYCSTEGRALMSMDLASFAAGIDPSSIMDRMGGECACKAPPKVNPFRGMRYLDTYIKVFYYPKEDVIEWIRHNYENYQLNHCLSLAANAFRTESGEENNGIPVEVALEAVKNIYQTRSKDEAIAN